MARGGRWANGAWDCPVCGSLEVSVRVIRYSMFGRVEVSVRIVIVHTTTTTQAPTLVWCYFGGLAFSTPHIWAYRTDQGHVDAACVVDSAANVSHRRWGVQAQEELHQAERQRWATERLAPQWAEVLPQ